MDRSKPVDRFWLGYRAQLRQLTRRVCPRPGWWRRRLGRLCEGLLCPSICPSCGDAVRFPGELCAPCRDGLDVVSEEWSCPRCTGVLPCRDCDRFRGRLARIRASYAYHATGGALVRRMKLLGDWAALGFLGRGMARLFRRRDPVYRRCVLVPIPLASGRRRERGFNQALELARHLARRLELPLCPGALVRVRETLPQGSPLVQSRAKNLEGALALGYRGRDLSGLPVLLVDDVVTSGATLRACARVLIEDGGAARVEAVVACTAHRSASR